MAHPPLPEARSIRVLTLTISDSRTAGDDLSGQVLRDALLSAGFSCVRHQLLPDDQEQIRSAVAAALDAGEVHAVISTGGTGIGLRDQTYEAVSSLLEKRLDGFGEAFRRLSWERIGPRAILSRAVAGTYRRVLVVALPGSPRAVELGVCELIIPTLAHAVSLL